MSMMFPSSPLVRQPLGTPKPGSARTRGFTFMDSSSDELTSSQSLTSGTEDGESGGAAASRAGSRPPWPPSSWKDQCSGVYGRAQWSARRVRGRGVGHPRGGSGRGGAGVFWSFGWCGSRRVHTADGLQSCSLAVSVASPTIALCVVMAPGCRVPWFTAVWTQAGAGEGVAAVSETELAGGC